MTFHLHRDTFRLTLTCTLCILTLAPKILHAQLSSFQESWRWARFTTESGLPSDVVYSITETPAGTIWVGTERGLAWFDNYSWNAIDTTKGIPPTQIVVMEPFGRDSVLVVTKGALYLGSRNGFTLLIPDSGKAGYIQSVVVNDRNQIFLLGQEFLFSYEGGALHRIDVPARPLSSGLGRNLWRTASGKFWLNTTRRLCKGDGTNWSLAIHAERFEFTAVEVLENRRGTGLAAIASPLEHQGLREWERHVPPHLSSTERQGLQQTMDMLPSGDVIVVYWKHFGTKEGLTADRVHKIRRDRKGRLWFLGLGANYNDRAHQQGAFVFENGVFTHWGARDSTHEGLINGRVYAFAEGSDGSRWFGTKGGLSRWKDGTWHHWTQFDGLLGQNERIYSIAIDSGGTVWFSNVSTGLGTVDKENNVRFLTTADGLVNDAIRDLKVDPNGTLWISTERGLSSYNNGI